MRNLLHRQEGAMGMILVIGFMALAIPLITAALTLSGTLARDSQVKTNILKRQYAALGVVEYVSYLAADPIRWNDWKTANFVPASGNYQESLIISGQNTNVTVAPLAVSPGDAPAIPISPLQTQLSANPAVLPEGNDLTLTLTITNLTTGLEDLTKIYIGLPPGFRYHGGSTTGVTTADPVETVMSSLFNDTPDYDLVTWDLTSLDLQLQPSQSVTLSFVAHTDDPEGNEEGNFCVRGWVGAAGGVPSNGSTVQVTLGEAYEPCLDNRLETVTTVSPQIVPTGGATHVFTYTTTVQNVGTETQLLTGIRDVLPLGFNYKLNTTSGDLTNSNPSATLLIDGRWELNWTFPSEIPVPPGGTKTLVIQAEAQPGLGNWYIEAIPFYKGQGIKVNKLAHVDGELVSTSDRKVMLKGNVHVDGGIRSGGPVRLHQNVHIHHSANKVVSENDIMLQQNAHIDGVVLYVGQLQLQSGASVDAASQQVPAGSLTIVPTGLSSPAFLTGTGPDITVKKNQPVTLTPGSYGKLKIEKQAELTLEAGQYSFDEVRAHQDAEIDLNLSGGTIVVDVAKDLTFDQRVDMEVVGGSPYDVTFRTMGGVVLKKNGEYRGNFLAFGGERQAAYTWPAAVVRVMDVFQVTTTNALGEIGSFEQWVGVDSSFLNRPIIGR